MDVAHALEELTPFLPAGARWLPLAVWLFAGLVIGPLAAGAGLWLAGGPLRRLRRSGAEVHWTERTRLGYPMLAVSGGCGLILPIVLAGAPATSRNALSAVPTVALSVVLMAALYLSALAVRRRATRNLSEIPLTYWETARGEWLGLALLTPQLFVMVAMALSIGSAFDALDVVQSAIGVGAFALTSHSAGIPFLRLLGAVRPADPPLLEIVDEVARRAGVRVRRVWVVDWPCVNALALPWSRQLVYTKQLLARLDRDEVAAFTAHELGHLSEPVSVKLVRSVGVFALLPIGFAGLVVGRYGLVGLAAVMVAAYAVLIAVVQVARRMEHRADQVAHTHDPDDGIYARALEKAYRANGAPAVMPQKRPVHPHLYDRLTTAGVAPDFPRPAPPSRKRAFAGMLLGAVLAGFAAGAVLIVPRYALSHAGNPDRAALWAVVVGNAKAASTAGFLHAADPDPAQAIAWLGLAHALDPRDHDSGAFAAELLAYRGRCDRARELLGEAETRAVDAGDDDRPWIHDAHEALSWCEAEAPREGV
jgi:Zn-dependent protease with chaperone function